MWSLLPLAVIFANPMNLQTLMANRKHVKVVVIMDTGPAHQLMFISNIKIGL